MVKYSFANFSLVFKYVFIFDERLQVLNCNEFQDFLIFNLILKQEFKRYFPWFFSQEVKVELWSSKMIK
jgi:hypothetical protein